MKNEKFELKTWTFDGFEVRTIDVNGEPWWVLKDVCTILEIKNHKEVPDRLEPDEVGRFDVPHPQNPAKPLEMVFINESGLYSVILRSDKPKARQFRKWVTSEVLPSIRKNGFYGTDKFLADALNNPDFAIEMLNAYKQERDNRKMLEHKVVRLETKIENDAPMVEFAKALADSDELLTVGEFACIVNQALAVSFTDVSVGRNQMFEILRENGHLLSQKSMRNAPSSFMSKNDYMRIVKVYSDRDRRYNPETRITHSGAMYLFKSLRNQFRKESKRDSFRRMF